MIRISERVQEFFSFELPMSSLSVMLLTFCFSLLFFSSCKDSDDPCLDFIDAEDLYIYESISCDGAVALLDITARLNVLDEKLLLLDVDYEWEVDGITHMGATLSLPRSDRKREVTLRVFNYGCEFIETYEFDLDVNRALLGNVVWVDSNDGVNNIYDSSDVTTTAGVNYGLLVDVLDPIDSSIVDQMMTDMHGQYLFHDLVPGDYLIRFHKPEGYDFVFPNSGFDDSVDSDCDRFGYTEVITLTECETNLTIDAGLKKN